MSNPPLEWAPQSVVNFTPTLHHDTYPYITPSPGILSGKNVLITGASSGCGKAMALSCAQSGASGIAILARRDLRIVGEEVAQAALEAGHSKPTILLLQADQTSQSAVEAAALTVKETLGYLDILVNNAGYLETWKPIVESDPEEWWRTWEVNIKGPYLLSRSFIPLLLSNASAARTIVQITSLGGLATGAGASAYQGTKTAIIRFSNYLRVEYEQEGLLVHNLHPGAVRTDLAERMPQYVQGILLDEPRLVAHTLVWLTRERREWLQDRFVSAAWDMQELEGRRDEILRENLLRFRMVA